MKFLPLFHSLQGRLVLVVGGGDVALRKARLLHAAGAHLRVVAPQLHAEIPALSIELHQRPYATHDLDGTALVVAATSQADLNAAVSEQAQARGIPVNVVDSPALCSAVFPAVVDRSPLVVAVGSGGHAPVLARLVRAKIETWLPARYGELAGLARQFRGRVKTQFSDIRQRRIFWEQVFQGPVSEAVFAGQLDLARHLLECQLEGPRSPIGGDIYLIGTGPGDPDLLTFRALRLMQQADAVLCEPTVPPTIVDLCRRDADRIPYSLLLHKPETNGLHPLIELAKQGKRVALLLASNAALLQHADMLQRLDGQRISYHLVQGVGPLDPTILEQSAAP